MAYSLLGLSRVDTGRPRAARALPRADLQAARHVAERARSRLPDAQSHAEELPTVPERSPLPSTRRAVRSAVDHHHERRRLHRCDRARHGRVHSDDRQPRPRPAAESDFSRKLRAVLEATYRSRGIRTRRELRLRHRRRPARRQRTAETHRRHGVVHVGAAGRHLGRHRRFRFGQRTAGISSECCREVRAATHACACRKQEGTRRARARFGIRGRQRRRLRRCLQRRARSARICGRGHEAASRARRPPSPAAATGSARSFPRRRP